MTPGAGNPLVPDNHHLTIAKKAPPARSRSGHSNGVWLHARLRPMLPPASDYDCSGGAAMAPEYTGYVR